MNARRFGEASAPTRSHRAMIAALLTGYALSAISLGCSSVIESHAKQPDRYEEVLSRNTPAVSTTDAPIEVLTTASEQAQASEAQAERLQAKQLPVDWSRVGIVSEDQYVLLVRDAVRFSNGSLGTFIRVLQKPLDRTGAVVIVKRDGRFLLLRHYRHATGKFHLEFVRGWADPDDANGAETARREVVEELGVEPADVAEVRILGYGYPDSGLLATKVCFVLATLSDDAKLKGDAQEGILGVVARTREEIRVLIRAGGIDDNFTLAALQFLEATEP